MKMCQGGVSDEVGGPAWRGSGDIGATTSAKTRLIAYERDKSQVG